MDVGAEICVDVGVRADAEIHDDVAYDVEADMYVDVGADMYVDIECNSGLVLYVEEGDMELLTLYGGVWKNMKK